MTSARSRPDSVQRGRLGRSLAAAAGILLVVAAIVAEPPSANAAFPGVNGEIVYASDGVVAVGPDGVGRQVTDRSVINLDVSPDGQTIVMVTGDGPISVVSMAGGPVHDLIPREVGGRPDVSWSPDGAQFVVALPSTVTVYDADGGNPRRLADRDADPTLGNRFEAVEWSANGSIYTLSFGTVLRITPDGTAIDRLSIGFDGWSAIGDRGLDASPDGTLLLVSCFRDTPDEPNVPQLCLTDADFTLQSSINSPDVRPEYASFSPDGTRISFNAAATTEPFARSIYTVGTDGSGLARVAASEGLGLTVWAPQPATPPQPLPEPPPPPSDEPLAPGGFDGDPATNERADFTNPILYAIAVSRARFDGPAGDRPADHVVLSRDDAFADSLVGAALTREAPLLFTPTATLDASTAAEIDRLLEQGQRVFLLGGTSAVSADVEATLAQTYDVVRLSGPSRVETSVAVAGAVLNLAGEAPTVAIARAGGPADNPTAAWADSVSAGAWTARDGVPTVVTDTASLHPAVATFLESVAPARTVLLGGTGALSQAVEDAVPNPSRVSGASRAGTAQAIQSELLGTGSDGRRLVVINGFRADGWQFGLPAAGLAADAGAAIALVGDTVPPETAVMACSPVEVDVLVAGGLGAVTDDVVETLDTTPDCS